MLDPSDMQIVPPPGRCKPKAYLPGKKIIMTAMEDLESTHKFLFLCAADWSIRFGGREHVQIVPRDCYKSNALLYWEV